MEQRPRSIRYDYGSYLLRKEVGGVIKTRAAVLDNKQHAIKAFVRACSMATDKEVQRWCWWIGFLGTYTSQSAYDCASYSASGTCWWSGPRYIELSPTLTIARILSIFRTIYISVRVSYTQCKDSV